MRNIPIVLFSLIPFILFAQPQQQVLDEVVAIVGNEIILKSEIISQMEQVEVPEGYSERDVECELLDQLLLQKMLLSRAKIDSLEISPIEVEEELDRRIRYFARQLGSMENLEKYYNKTEFEIKEEFRPAIRDIMLAQRMQEKVISKAKITPKEVKKYFESLPKDSLPYLSATVEVGHIVRYPKPSAAEREEAMKSLRDMRKRIVEGTDFSAMARLYSEDEGSAKKGGDIGEVNRSDLDPGFADAAFRLRKDSISGIVESQFGFHLIEMLERRGEVIRVRHILIRPKIKSASRQQARNFLDSLKEVVTTDTLTFAEAAILHSEDQLTRNNGGMLSNPNTGSARLSVDQLQEQLFYVVDTMKVGNIAGPVEYTDDMGQTAFRLIHLKMKTSPHRANLKDDYQQIQEVALQAKQEKIMQDWMVRNISHTFLKVSNDYMDCPSVKKYLEAQRKPITEKEKVH